MTKEKIEEAANNPLIELLPKREVFISGALSPEAKEYWLEKLTEEFESKDDNETVAVIEVVNSVLKSDLAKERWQKGMYSEGDIRNIFEEVCGRSGYDELLDKWFELNKKK